MDSFFLVLDESAEANEEVDELTRLLEEARERQRLVNTGQGSLSWWSSLKARLAWWLWGWSVQDPGCTAQESSSDGDLCETGCSSSSHEQELWL